LTAAWHEAAGTLPPAVRLRRRRARLLGAGAELFYEEPLHIVRGEDVWLIDAAGRRFLDVYNNVAHVGHAHPTVAAAPSSGSRATLATHSRYLHEGILDYAEALCARLPIPSRYLHFRQFGQRGERRRLAHRAVATGNAAAR
jgi:4-aminobutyrate aminotransferase-like enzyme